MNDGMTGAQKQLRDLIKFGPATSLYRAEQAYQLFMLVGENATAVNYAGFGDLFGNLQDIFLGRYALESSKVFERENGRHPTRGLPTALSYLENHSAALDVHDPRAIFEFLESLGIDQPESGDELTLAVVGAARDVLGGRQSKRWGNVAGSLKGIRVLRDKKYAHDEAYDFANASLSTWHEVQLALSFAKDLVGVLGSAYLNTVYVWSDGSFGHDTDAMRAATAMKRLLRKAGVLPPSPHEC